MSQRSFRPGTFRFRTLSIREKSICCIEGVRFEQTRQTKTSCFVCMQRFRLMTTITTTQTATVHPVLDGLRKIASSYLLRRLVKAVFTIWLVTTITFFVIRGMPGSAVDVLMQDLTAQGVSPDDARAQAAALMGIDLEQPLGSQYLEYLGNVVQGDFGHSYRSAGLSVTSMITKVLLWTLFSVGLSLIIT